MSELEKFLKNMNELLRKTNWQYECVFNTTDIEKLLKIVGVLSEALKEIDNGQYNEAISLYALSEANKIAGDL